MQTVANGLVQKIFLHREKVWFSFIVVFFITLYIPHIAAINSICIGCLFLFSFCMNPLKEKWQLLKSKLPVQLMLLFFLEHVISAFLSLNKQEAFQQLGMRTPLLLFPVALGLTGISDSLKKKMALAFAIVTTAAAVFCAVLFMRYYLETHAPVVAYVNNVLTTYIDKQNNYFGMMLLIAMGCYGYVLMQQKIAAVARAMIYAALLFLSVVLFLIASRMPIIGFTICSVLFAGLLVVKYRQFKTGLLIAAVVAAEAVLFCFVFTGAKERFSEVQHTVAGINREAPAAGDADARYTYISGQWNSSSVRLAIWKSDWQLAKQHLLTGSHLGDKMAGLLNVYKQNRFAIDFNAHNTYLDVLMTFGIIGFLLFVSGYFILPLRAAWMAGDWAGCFILLAMVFLLITESYLDRSIGCILLGFFIPLVGNRRTRVKPSKMNQFFQFEREHRNVFILPAEGKQG